ETQPDGSMLRQVHAKRCNSEASRSEKDNEDNAAEAAVSGDALSSSISLRPWDGWIWTCAPAFAKRHQQLSVRQVGDVFWRPSPACWTGDRAQCPIPRKAHCR